MTGKCDDFKEMLDLYVAGSLDPDMRPLVEDHIGSCDVCRKELALSRWLGSAVKWKESHGEGYHLATETLSDLVIAPDAIESKAREEALEHIAGCEPCRHEYRMLKRVAQEIEIDAPAERTRELDTRSLWSWLTKPWVPAWVAIACASVVLMVITWGVIPTRESAPPRQQLLASSGVDREFATSFAEERSMTVRGLVEVLENVPVTEITLEQGLAPLEMTIERGALLAESGRIDVEIHRLTDQGLRLKAMLTGLETSPDRAFISLQVPTGILDVGTYLLVIKPHELGQQDGEPARLFRLQVIVRDTVGSKP